MHSPAVKLVKTRVFGIWAALSRGRLHLWAAHTLWSQASQQGTTSAISEFLTFRQNTQSFISNVNA